MPLGIAATLRVSMKSGVQSNINPANVMSMSAINAIFYLCWHANVDIYKAKKVVLMFFLLCNPLSVLACQIPA